MKTSEELLGLPVISIEEGKELGRVIDYIINPKEGIMEFLVIDCGVRYFGVKILPFNKVIGVGEDAVIIPSRSSMSWRTSRKFLHFLTKNDVQVKGTKILTDKGTVSEFLVDADSGGEIAGCILSPFEGKGEAGIIPSGEIVTFGRDILVVNDGIESRLIEGLTEFYRQIAAAEQRTVVNNLGSPVESDIEVEAAV